MVRVGNCSGFYGDRLSAMREMLTGGELDVLTGDYLAELTMHILGRDRAKDQELGYARTFLTQLRDCLGLVLERGVRIVANAGGVNTPGLVAAIRQVADQAGLEVKVAHVRGDDLTAEQGRHGFRDALGVHAYLGAFGIAEALRSGADIVVTGRVTDASLVIGPAIAHFGWSRSDLDALAGATVAGHVIECGTQATGGNYPFFTEIDDLTRPGFPIAEIAADGSSVITKHPGTGGAVTVDTVTAQLVYEIGDARYGGPDVTTRLDSVQLSQVGTDRVRISGARGEPPPPEVKVSVTSVGGYRNEMTAVVTGLDVDAKVELFQRQFADAYDREPAELEWRIARLGVADAETEQQAASLVTVVARDPDPVVVGRSFSSAAVEVALGCFPGYWITTPPTPAAPYGVFTPGYVPQAAITHEVVLDSGAVVGITPPEATLALEPLTGTPASGAVASGPTTRAPLGRLVAARSGDKGGNANVGLWTRGDAAYRWLCATLTEQRLRDLLPEARELPIHLIWLPNIRAINIVIEGILGRGVAYNARFDAQAKGLGEWLRARHLDLPTELLGEGSPS
ncbi:MAG: DUF1446 domain-containing protein [Nocardioides sp.]